MAYKSFITLILYEMYVTNKNNMYGTELQSNKMVLMRKEMQKWNDIVPKKYTNLKLCNQFNHF